MKLFISQPMDGIPQATIDQVTKMITELYPSYELIDSAVSGENSPLYTIGECIKLMAAADLVVFYDNWYDYRGCRCEYKCAYEYNKKIVFINKKGEVYGDNRF